MDSNTDMGVCCSRCTLARCSSDSGGVAIPGTCTCHNSHSVIHTAATSIRATNESLTQPQSRTNERWLSYQNDSGFPSDNILFWRTSPWLHSKYGPIPVSAKCIYRSIPSVTTFSSRFRCTIHLGFHFYCSRTTMGDYFKPRCPAHFIVLTVHCNQCVLNLFEQINERTNMTERMNI